MKYIDAEKLKAEIERLKDEYTDIAIDSHYGTVNANSVVADLEQLLSLIPSSQQKQQKVDLEEEIERYTRETTHLPITHKRTPMDIMESDWVRCAHHFYELGQLVMRERIANPKYNQMILEKMKYEHPIDEVNTRKED